MRRANSMKGWTAFTTVGQDVPGTTSTTGGCLYTRNLMSCIGIAVSNGTNAIGMLHVSPGHEKQELWIVGLMEVVRPTCCVITGANLGGDEERLARLSQAFADFDFPIIDETRTGWLPATLGGCTVGRGQQTSPAGFLAVNGATNEYFVAADVVVAAADQVTNVPARKRRGRGSSRGTCIIF